MSRPGITPAQLLATAKVQLQEGDAKLAKAYAKVAITVPRTNTRPAGGVHPSRIDTAQAASRAQTA